MNASIRFTDDDRGPDGFVRIDPPEAPRGPDGFVRIDPPEAPRAPRAIDPFARVAPSPAAAPVTRAQIALIVGLIAIIAALLGIVLLRVQPTPTQPSPYQGEGQGGGATSAPAPTMEPSSAPTLPPVAMLPAYAAPDGARLGEIETTRAITPTAHYGSDWIQADVSGSGRIWLRSSDWPALAVIGPDLAPPPAPAWQPPLAVSLPSAQDVQDALTIPALDTPTLPPTGVKPAGDRAAHYATAVARLEAEKSGHGSKETR